MNVCRITLFFTDYSERSRLAGFTDYSERLRLHSSALPAQTSSKRVVDYFLIWYRCFSDPFRGHQQIATDYSERLPFSFAYHDPQWTSLLITVNITPGCVSLWNATDYSECLEQKEVKINISICWACLNTCQSPLSNADFRTETSPDTRLNLLITVNVWLFKCGLLSPSPLLSVCIPFIWSFLKLFTYYSEWSADYSECWPQITGFISPAYSE